MKFIKNALVSLALICSCSLLPSAPAPAQAIQDVEVPEYSLETYQKVITSEMTNLKNLCQWYPHIKEIHESANQHIQSEIDAQQMAKHFLKRQREGPDKAGLNLLQDQIAKITKVTNDLKKQLAQRVGFLKIVHPGDTLSFFIVSRNIYFLKAGYLQGVVNKQKTKIEQLTTQNQVAHVQIQERDTQIQQQAAHISALQAALNQLQNPDEQQIDASGVASQVGRHGLAEREGLPAAPGGVQIKKK